MSEAVAKSGHSAKTETERLKRVKANKYSFVDLSKFAKIREQRPGRKFTRKK